MMDKYKEAILNMESGQYEFGDVIFIDDNDNPISCYVGKYCDNHLIWDVRNKILLSYDIDIQQPKYQAISVLERIKKWFYIHYNNRKIMKKNFMKAEDALAISKNESVIDNIMFEIRKEALRGGMYISYVIIRESDILLLRELGYRVVQDRKRKEVYSVSWDGNNN